MKENNLWGKSSSLVPEKIDDEYLILDSEKNKFFRLNKVGGYIWKLCNNTNATTIAASISQRFNIRKEEALLDVQTYLEQLGELGLVIKIKPDAILKNSSGATQ